MPAHVKSPKQEKVEADARAIRRASTPLEYAAGIEGCIRLHAPHEVQEDGSPEFNHEFFAKLNASANAKRKQEAHAADQAALGAPRNFVTVSELERMIGTDPDLAVSRSTITRAISRQELAASRSSTYGIYRIAWPSAKTYLAARGYPAEAIAAMEQRWASTEEAY